MEPKMISLKVLSTAAAIALVVPMVVPSESFAQAPPNVGGVRAGGGGGGGSAGVRVGGGGGGGGVRGIPGEAPAAANTGGIHVGGGAPGPRYSGGGGGYYRGGGGGGYYRHHGGGGFIPGAVAGAVVGGALASQSYGYYGGPGYYDDSYGYYDNDSVAVEAAPGGDASYCAQRYRSYDPASGTYLGNDGYRHPCP
jgi:BA14K-like protein